MLRKTVCRMFEKRIESYFQATRKFAQAWWRHTIVADDVKKAMVICNRLFLLCSLYTQCTFSIQSNGQELHEAVKYEPCEEPWTKLFPTQKWTAHIVQILQANKILKERVYRIFVNCNGVRSVEHRISFFSTLVTTSCSLVTASVLKNF